MAVPQIPIEFGSLDKLEAEFENNLSKGGTFAPGAAGVDERQPCEIVLEHPLHGQRLVLDAEVVWVRERDPGKGIALQLKECGPEVIERIRAFIDSESGSDEEDASIPPPPAAASEDDPVPPPPVAGADDEAAGDQAEEAEGEEEAEGVEEVEGEEAEDPEPDDDGTKPPAKHVYERLRRISLAEQQRLARSGRLNERVALEKLHGKNVWEALLQNRSLTPPEAAKIAKKGTLPKPLLEQIASNTAWLGSSIVRRALLANHKLSQASAQRILGLLNKSELNAVPLQTAYPERVRAAAKRLIKSGRGPRR